MTTTLDELERLLAEATELKAQGRGALYICKCILILDALPDLIAAARERDRLTAQVQDLLKGWAEECDGLKAENGRLREALYKAQHSMRAPLDDWKGTLEREALDAARVALAEKEKP